LGLLGLFSVHGRWAPLPRGSSACCPFLLLLLLLLLLHELLHLPYCLQLLLPHPLQLLPRTVQLLLGPVVLLLRPLQRNPQLPRLLCAAGLLLIPAHDAQGAEHVHHHSRALWPK